MGTLNIDIKGIALHSPGDIVWVKESTKEVFSFAPTVFSTRVQAIRIEFSDPDQEEFSLYYVTEGGVFGADRVFHSEAAARRG